MGILYDNLIGSFTTQATSNKSITISGTAAITADGGHGEGHIYIHDGISSSIIGSFSYSGTSLPRNINSSYYHNGSLLVGDTLNDYIYAFDMSTESIIGSLTSQAFPGGLTVSGTNLYEAQTVNDFVYIHDGITSAITGSFDSNVSTLRGITFDGSGNFVFADDATNILYTFSGTNIINGVVIGSFTLDPALTSPREIHYHSVTDQLLVTQDAGHIYIYERTPPSIPFTETLSDTINITDAFIDIFGKLFLLSDSLSISEVSSNEFIHVLSEIYNMSDSLNQNTNFTKLLADNLISSDSLSQVIGFSKSITDTLTFSDALDSILTKFITITALFNIINNNTRRVLK